MSEAKPVVVPEPAKLEFRGRWLAFDGFSNLDPFIAEEFGIPKGKWEITPSEGHVEAVFAVGRERRAGSGRRGSDASRRSSSEEE